MATFRDFELRRPFAPRKERRPPRCALVAARAHYIAKARRDKLGISGLQKIVAYDRQSEDIFAAEPIENKVVTPARSGEKNADISMLNVGMARSEGVQLCNKINILCGLTLPKRALSGNDNFDKGSYLARRNLRKVAIAERQSALRRH